ncbi:Holliday junction DNA helicase RuvA [candidate division WOR-1 bacterium RIFCSPHIGHO2_01_FULL_53_15]|uniref:Putative pre-16S rRNA nuclease n=1 Tax=candidate division WOR-1 bacterium RIFCSPHIGHO2_01_FULL_53_15 TaxID=1802564 RepID=A0A1F4Q497_UNCSA|nr:MAG: Holliday junction DNA helicase RuvA [candidate division WOR-1 bacterium RIFCSPHIGHO2_01_FULL_53_15]OGC13940.1 MAG: Holliday junction DNA helicase RuvA [candidate division WOR-1 bacterium RIFCSPHIGHO2_02_FULL_53_26]
MRRLGIDFGDKRIGIAISDPTGLIATGIAMIGKGETFEPDIREIKRLIKKYDGVAEIVVGMPKTLAGKTGPQAEKVMAFIEALKNEFKLNIVAWDERLTTAEAERGLIEAGLSREKRKRVIDQSAAAVILQSYLDRKRKP